MKKEDAEFLNQLANSLKEAGARIEDAYREKRYEEFLKLKRFVLEIQNRIKEVIE